MYSISYNGFTLTNDSNHTINKLDGLSRVEIRVSEDPLTGRDGGNIWEQMYNMRTIEIGGFVFADNSTDYYAKRREMLSAFTPKVNRQLTITLSDGSQMGIMAKVASVPLFREEEGEKDGAEYQVILKAQDPFFYSLTENSIELLPAIVGGTPVASPVASPVGGTGGGTSSLENGGDVPLFATVTFTGTVTNPTLSNTSTGEYFKIATTLLEGQQIIIYKDTTGLYVKDVATGASYMAFFKGTFFEFPVGITNLAFSATSTTPSSACTITWHDKYLGF